MSQPERMNRSRRSMLKLLGLAAVGATGGMVAGRIIDAAGGQSAGPGSSSPSPSASGDSAGPAGSATSVPSAPPEVPEVPEAPGHSTAPGPDVRLRIGNEPGVPRMGYGPDTRQYGDLYLPPGSSGPADDPRPVPLVVMIHGGGWRDAATADHAVHQVKDLTAEGVAVWNIEYRGVGGAGGWPHTYDDVANAIDAVPHVAGASPVPLDLGRVSVLGYSAGGNLAAWAANREALPAGDPGARPAFPVRNCVCMCGVYDLARAIRWGDPFIGPLLGGTPEEVPDRYRTASPIAYFAPDVRTVILHGRNDAVVDVQQAISYEAAARRHGRPVEMLLFDDAGHGSWGDITGPQWQAAKDAVLAQLR